MIRCPLSCSSTIPSLKCFDLLGTLRIAALFKTVCAHPLRYRTNLSAPQQACSAWMEAHLRCQCSAIPPVTPPCTDCRNFRTLRRHLSQSSQRLHQHVAPTKAETRKKKSAASLDNAAVSSLPDLRGPFCHLSFLLFLLSMPGTASSTPRNGNTTATL